MKRENVYLWTTNFGYLALLIGSSFQPLYAQQPQKPASSDSSARVDPTKARYFPDALQSLSEQTGGTFVVEGTPLHSTLTTAASAALNTANVPLTDLIKKVALAYDYDVLQQGKVFVLKKLYTDFQDLPGLTFPECFQSLQTIEMLTDSFNPHIPQSGFDAPDLLAKTFVGSLSASQLQLLGQKKLHIGMLNQSQTSNVQRIARYLYVQNSVRGISQQRSLLADPSKIIFCWHDFEGHRVFGYELITKSNTPVGFRPLPHKHTVQSDKIPPQLVVSLESNGVSTLGKEIDKLNSSQVLHIPVAVDSVLTSKPITIVGNNNITASRLLDAFATIYSLQVIADNNSGLRLTTISVKPPEDIKFLSKAVRSALPEPLLRALRSDELNDLELRADNAASEPNITKSKLPVMSPKLSEKQQFVLRQARLDEYHARFERIVELTRRSHSLEESATQQLTSLILPKMPSLESRIALSSLGEEAKRAFASMIMAQAMGNMQKLVSRNPPRYITDTDNLVIGGGFGTSENGRPFVNVTLYLQSLNDDNLLEQCGYTRFLRP